MKAIIISITATSQSGNTMKSLRITAYLLIAIHFLRKILRKLSPAKPLPRSLRPRSTSTRKEQSSWSASSERLLAKPHSVYFDGPDGPVKLALCEDAYVATNMLMELRERLVPCFMKEDSESVNPVTDAKLREYAVIPLVRQRATLEATAEVCRRKTGKVHPKARDILG